MNTESLSKEEIKKINDANAILREKLENQKYGYELGIDNADPKAKAKSRSLSIMIINGAFVAILLSGIIGSFWEVFNMEKFVKFMEIFAYVWAPLVVTVGGGRSLKNWSEKKFNQGKKQDQPPV